MGRHIKKVCVSQTFSLLCFKHRQELGGIVEKPGKYEGTSLLPTTGILLCCPPRTPLLTTHMGHLSCHTVVLLSAATPVDADALTLAL